MTEETLRQLLNLVRGGELPIDDAVARLRRMPYEDIGFAQIDHHRAIRCGFPEVIYSEGKTTEQVVAIFGRCAESGANVLATRASRKVFDAIAAVYQTKPVLLSHCDVARFCPLHPLAMTASTDASVISVRESTRRSA